MTRFRATIRYLGTAYHGFQMQPHHLSVQEVLQNRLQRILREDIIVNPSGRTDTGVHALAQVIHFDVRAAHALERALSPKFLYNINSILPDDIGVLSVEQTRDDFHARRDCVSKTYTYWILQDAVQNPFLAGRVWQIPKPLDVAAMQEAAQHLVGEHDFSAFCAADSLAVKRVKSLTLARITSKSPAAFFTVAQGEPLCLEFTADGFLKQMVRNIVGTLVQVGRAKILPSQLKTILASKDRTTAGATAPASGLYLTEVHYS